LPDLEPIKCFVPLPDGIELCSGVEFLVKDVYLVSFESLKAVLNFRLGVQVAAED
jgi:hypothetical protein